MTPIDDRKRALTELREKIARVDEELLAALNQRASLSGAIHQLLEDSPRQLNQPELGWLETLRDQNQGPLSPEAAEFVFQAVRAVARRIEQPARVAYVGAEGGFVHEVAKGHFGPGAGFIECPSASAALEEVARERAAYAVLPWDSSVDGLVKSSVVALAQTNLVLCAGRQLPATFHAMTHSVELSSVQRVYATAAARAACSLFLNAELSKTSVIDVKSPYIAAQLAREDATGAAIVPESCGHAMELKPTAVNVGDEPDMRMRYGIVGAVPAQRSDVNHTCLLFSVQDTPGALFEVLRHFAERRLNLKKLQTMPAAAGADNMFYVEVQGHETDRAMITALEEIKHSAEYVRVLGSLPMA